MPTDPPEQFELDVEENDEQLSLTEMADDASEGWIDAQVIARFASELDEDALTRGDRRLPADLATLKRGIQRAQREAAIAKKPVTFDFDGYQVSSCVNGGMGMVLRAWDPDLTRELAIKLWLEPGPEGNTDLLEEARTLARRNHPNIVTVYGTGVWNEKRRYFTMEWIDGSDAKQWLRQSRRWQEIRDLFVEAGKGLAAAHEVGIQHRDFKPSNILVGNDGRVCVADFGLADTMRSSDPLSESSGLAGTWSYIAPERIERAKGDGRSDQYSFCVALWEALHGVMPFCAPSVRELVRVIEAGVTAPVKRDSELPHWLSRVVRKGLSFDPDQRYPDMGALLEALKDEADPGARIEGGSNAERQDFERPGYMHKRAQELVAVVPQGLGRRQVRRGFMVGAGLVGGVLATLLAVGVVEFSNPTETDTSHAIPLSQRDRAQLKFNEARKFVKQRKMQDAYDAWDEGKDLLLREDPNEVGKVAMELADAILEREPKRVVAGWLAIRGAAAFEAANNWKRAAEAARLGVKVFRRAGHQNDVREYEVCEAENDAGRPCASLSPSQRSRLSRPPP